MDTIWNDVSEWQCPVNDTYPYPVLAIRSNDGTYRDNHFQENYGWALRALGDGRLRALIIYLVYRPDWRADLATLISVVGSPPHGRVAIMLDVESWSAEIQGDQSDPINRLYWGIADWMGDPRRVIGYGNRSDLDTLWPTRPPGVRIILAAYGSDPDYPGKLGHQFTDGVFGGPLTVPPFGAVDVNSADGYDTDAFCAALGIGDDMGLTPEEHGWLEEVHHESTLRLQSRVAGATSTDTVLGYAANSDAFGYRIEQDVIALQAQLAATQTQVGVLTAAMGTLTAVAAATHELTATDVQKIFDTEIAKISGPPAFVTDSPPSE